MNLEYVKKKFFHTNHNSKQFNNNKNKIKNTFNKK